jgi:glycosyltransferase involved in cell wall biosynthesis
MLSVAVIGTVGVPANYGGFETLAENLVKFHKNALLKNSLTVYCSSKSYPLLKSNYLTAQLRYIPLNANGAQSIFYDVWSLVSAVRHRSDVILLLGVSGAIALPLIRLFSSARIVTNIDGIEWRREKWQGWAKHFLRWSEKLAIRHSHELIADNAAIAAYIKKDHGANCNVIAYGGDHAVSVATQSIADYGLPSSYAISVCRIEPENNVHMVLEAFARQSSLPLVMVGNWASSDYGRGLLERYAGVAHFHLLGAIYELGILKSLRAGAALYVHGHSAGGTNPSLVEAMHFALPVLAYDCEFNRATTEEKALYFCDANELVRLINFDERTRRRCSAEMLEIAQRRYTWEVVAQQYFGLLLKDHQS